MGILIFTRTPRQTEAARRSLDVRKHPPLTTFHDHERRERFCLEFRALPELRKR